ncbi:MAG: hypothetical protein F4Y00_11425 [Bacteroidetes bacterium SB0662_bin_6]|nr:hypothetical protein [Bacteroidetes bacterium SB0668_bin_1]MYE05564.1 hypothetical protein [Bacteroidetes bacterium SB0662_bin_6]
MDTSFEEKSVWIQLASLVVGLGGYLVVAGLMLSNGVSALPPFVPIFAVAIVLIVAVNIAGHVVAAITSRSDEADERDRLIGWRAESGSSWILGIGVIGAIMALILSVGGVWVAHLLLISLFGSEVAKDVLQIVYYRRGI